MLARLWWLLTRPAHEGALAAIWCDHRLLLLRQSYQRRLAFPGGGVRRGESPADAVLRELVEELGLNADPALLAFACRAREVWDGRRDTVTFFELHLPREPALVLDMCEITGARFVPESDLTGLRVSRPVAHYLAWRAGGGVAGDL